MNIRQIGAGRPVQRQMADVCIFYSRQDASWPPRLEAMLSPRWSVWWDKDINGPFPQAVCRQSISDSWLGNLRECLAHLI